MKALDHKLVRDLTQMKAQAAAIGMLLACAMATLTGAMGTYRTLTASRDAFYESNRFPDLFASLSRAPQSLLPRIAVLPGVSEAHGRIVELVPLELEGRDEPASALLHSIPLERPSYLNRVRLLAGRMPTPGAWEALASQAFVEGSGVRPGDSVTLLINGLRQRVLVVGVALAPDTIYSARPGELMPDDSHFGVFWLGEQQLATAFAMEQSFNDLAIRLAPGARSEEVEALLDEELVRYGGLSAFGRRDHPSHRFLSDDLEQLRLLAVLLPAVFFGVAAYLLNMVLSRLVTNQREQIAAIKALGYGSLRVGVHYLKMGSVIVAVAALAGSAGGMAMTAMLAGFYARDLYRLPTLVIDPDPTLFLIATLLGFVAAGLGVAGAVRKVVALPPAEAMRPAAPPTYKPTLLERLGIGRFLSQPGRMVLRSLGRRPLRTLASATGIGAAAAILVASLSFIDAIEELIAVQFRRAERQDVTVTFTTALGPDAVQELSRMPEVLLVEAFRAAPVLIHASGTSRRTTLLGLEPDGLLKRMLDRDSRPHSPPATGVLLSAKLAELVGVRPGDTVAIEVLEGQRPQRTVLVAGLVDDLLGTNAGMSRAALNRLLGEGDLASGVYVSLDPTGARTLNERLRGMPVVAGVSMQSRVLESFERFTGMLILIFAGVLVGFAVLIAAGVVYNAARVLVAERERELATLRVLGFSRAEISMILLGELGAQLLLALPLGFLAGYALAAGVCSAMTSDLMRMPLVVRPAVFAISGGVVTIASLLVALAVRRRLDGLDLVAVLKSRE